MNLLRIGFIAVDNQGILGWLAASEIYWIPHLKHDLGHANYVSMINYFGNFILQV